MNRPRILIAGIGNIFLGDDAFGVEVVQRLARRPLPEGVRVVDFGIRGLDLTYALLDGWDAVILVDATPRGGRPGTLWLLEPESPTAADADEAGPGRLALEPHNMDPVKVLRLAAAMGSPVRRLLLVGCEPTPLAEAEDMQMDMSEPVRAAVDQAIPLIESVVAGLLEGEGHAANGEDHERATAPEGGPCTSYPSP
jgi:hydrogenase maturation protease